MFAPAQQQAARPDKQPEKPGTGTIVVTRHCPRDLYRPKWCIDQFVVAKKLGGGYASTVHLAIDKATGTQVAIKVYHRCKLSQLNNYQVQREIRIHSCVDHKNVLQLLAAFEDEVGIYLVTEYASRGDVFGELDRRGGSMTESDAVRQVLGPFLSALEYLHMLNIIHRDIKPENLLFTATGVLKVADFGLSIDITQERPVTRVGTLDYMAPEVVICPDKCHPNDHKEKTHLHYTYLVDAWAVGVLAYELTVGRAPFDAGHKRGTIENILHSAPRFPAWVSDSCKHFVAWSLTKETGARPGIQQLAEHPWIHQHAGAARPSKTQFASAGRAVSFHNLSMYTDPAAARSAQQQQQQQLRAKMGEGLPSGGSKSSSSKPHEPEPEAEDEVFVSASGEACPAAGAAAANGAAGMEGVTAPEAAPAAAAAACSKPSSVSRVPSCGRLPVPGSAIAVSAASGSAAAAAAAVQPPAGVACSHGTVTTQGAASSPFEATDAQAPPAAAPSSPSTLLGLPMLGAAADKLRAFVHRCQSANDLESVKALMLLQPPEPSNACFEPGGRFYSGTPAGPAAALGSQPQHMAGSSTAAAAKHGMSGHDSAASLGVYGASSSSSSSSRPADLPRGPSPTLPVSPSAASLFALPKPLQVVKLPASLQAVPRSDSCRSLQGLAGISEGKAEGKDSSMGGDGQQQQQRPGSLQGAASSSPMAVSPAAPGGALQQHQQQLGSKGAARSVFDSPESARESPRERSSPSRSRADVAASPSASSCSCSYSSSCGNGMAGSTRGSVCSAHSWGYTQQQQHLPHQPPQPPSPPRHASKACSARNLFGSCHDAAGAAASAGKSAAGPVAEGAAGAEVGRHGSCQEFAAAKRTLLAISADCRTASETEQQQQQLAGLSSQNNGCFGFLKSPRR
ncbi:hypothetical protein COO60DRAFT_297186 [Scenedesmus sp. NREL 46B-D3]|nr:hypothetical protein COO60DRAFT_297186 [Scenedesmus sp. NREL 46B-D3]